MVNEATNVNPRHPLAAIAVVALGLTACGGPPAPEIDARLRIPSALSEQVAALDVYVLGPKMTDGIFLPCTVLLANDGSRVAPDDAKVEQLGYQNVAFDALDPTITFDEIEAGPNRLVYVGALDADDELIGEGCLEKLQVDPNLTTEVTVTVYEYPPP